MSCDGNRHRYFSFMEGKHHGLNSRHLETLYQQHKARGPQSPEEEVVQTHKTQQLFLAMRQEGIKPPTHAANGLPKRSSRSGYAAVYDAIQMKFKKENRSSRHSGPLDDLHRNLGPLKDGQGYRMATGRNDDGDNRWGWRAKHRADPSGRSHVWFGKGNRWHYVLNRRDATTAEEEYDRIIRGSEAIPEDFLQPDVQGLLEDGYDLLGFDANHHNRLGYNIYSIHRDQKLSNDEYREIVQYEFDAKYSPLVKRDRLKKPKRYDVDLDGFGADGFMPRYPEEKDDKDRFGFNRHGFKSGRSWTGYDEEGLDQQGNPRPQVTHYDGWGYHRKEGLTEPDKKGRRYNLIGWQYDPKKDSCFNPENPKETMPHSGSFKNTRDYGVVMKRSYVPDVDQMVERMKNPAIRHTEIAAGSDYHRYVGVRYDSDQAELGHSHPRARYLRSEAFADKHPDAAYLHICLRCPKCGQFTGAKPHICPAMQNKKIIAFDDGMIAALRPANGIDYSHTGFWLELQQSLNESHDPKGMIDEAGQDIDRSRWINLRAGAWLDIDPLESMLHVLETPYNPSFDPEFEGGTLPGFSYATGLDRDGFNLYGFNPETGLNRDGDSLDSLLAAGNAAKELEEKFSGKKTTEETDKRLLEGMFSGVASSLAGAPRRVVLEEKGGPRDGMFGTNLRGKISAERYPLGKDADLARNILAMKAGIYHELGHEEDTPPEIWARALQIAQGKEEVEGLSKRGAGKVAELFNIVEDGRMERVQAKRRRGVAMILAADSKIQPRWDEAVGEGVPLEHQLTGMMLYRSLPFFKVRQEVYEKTDPRARKLFDEIAPLVDRATSGSVEEALFAAVEIARKLDQDEEIKKERKEQQKKQGKQGGQGDGKGRGYFVTATPQAVQGGGSGGQKVQGTPIPAPGWGQGKKADNDPQDSGKEKGKKTEEDQQGEGRKKGSQNDDQQGSGKQKGKKVEEEKGDGRKKGKKDDDEQGDGQGKGEKDGDKENTSADPQFTALSPEPDSRFFFDVSANTSLSEILTETANDALRGPKRRGRMGEKEKKAAQALQMPSASMPALIKVPVGDNQDLANVFTKEKFDPPPFPDEHWERLDQQARSVGKRLGQRLERLKASIRQKQRYQTSGKVDRRRFKRAVAGSRTAYQQSKMLDVTSLAVSLSVDMSGSMMGSIINGELFGAVSAISTAMEHLDAEYSVNAFGTTTHLLKSPADKGFSLEDRKFFASQSLGSTEGRASVASASLSLGASPAANKIAFVLTDGGFDKHQAVCDELEKARGKGILPFGLFFGREDEATRMTESLNELYGKGNWVSIQSLDDLPKKAAGRIERIYRRLLAVR